MIVQITLANYRSIHAEQTLSFVAERGTRHKGNLIPRPGYRLLKAVALFGANASGKSNFVRAIGEMRDFVRDSATKMNDGDPIVCAQPYRLDPASRSAPSRFEITFVTDGVQYVYGFAATRERVHEEWLTATRENSNAEVFGFTRYMQVNSELEEWRFRGTLTNIAHLLPRHPRANALLLSIAVRNDVTELLPAYRYLREYVSMLDMSGAIESLFREATRRCKGDGEMLQQATSLLRDADTGIENIEIDPISLADILALATDVSLKQQDLIMAANRFTNPDFGMCVASSRQDTLGKAIEFDFVQDESRGTNRFFTAAVFLLDALQEGAFLVIDELDASMHPLLTRRLLEMFQSPDANPNGAQLLFTTHDAVLLDSALFRRDQIILAEKRSGASIFYSLADIEPPIRSTESFLRNYLAGRYGGTPHLGRTFEELELMPVK